MSFPVFTLKGAMWLLFPAISGTLVLSLSWLKFEMVLPDVKIILGGPEVSFDPHDILRSNRFVDYVMAGEGEGAFGLLLRSFTDEGINPDAIEGLSYRKNGEIHASTSFAW